MPKVSLTTLGCKLNSAETSTIGRQFVDRGFEVVPFGDPADVCVINTCSVTGRAERECRQVIRRALRTSPRPFVVVTGCYAQLAPTDVASIAGVDLVLGTAEKFDLLDHAGGLEKKLYPHVAVSRIETVDTFGPSQTAPAGERTRAFLKVQDGCDYHCSFCTIPMARGTSRSQNVASCVAQARDLVAHGFKEIVLTGVNVGDYGRKLGSDLLELLKNLVTVEGLERIRISSIEPHLLTRDILRFVADHEVMCRHFHIPLQSGDDDILRSMRRRYTTAHYAGVVERARHLVPDCGIGADVIVGFPGETDAHFENTLRFVNDLPLSYLHVFPYSDRPHTPSASFTGPVEPKVRFKRNEILRLLGQKKKYAFARGMIGTIAPVLLESETGGPLRYGFTDTYVRVGVSAATTTENTIVRVQIIGAGMHGCVGTVAGQEKAG
jgi:threonylcarbamoyladenosine tRNA methylthiotransferase MtaB